MDGEPKSAPLDRPWPENFPIFDLLTFDRLAVELLGFCAFGFWSSVLLAVGFLIFCRLHSLTRPLLTFKDQCEVSIRDVMDA